MVCDGNTAFVVFVKYFLDEREVISVVDVDLKLQDEILEYNSYCKTYITIIVGICLEDKIKQGITVISIVKSVRNFNGRSIVVALYRIHKFLGR